jgi:3-deoxy-7-phosphoheptulonate synthase
MQGVSAQIAGGSRCIFSMTVESYQHAGNQKFTPGKDDPAKLSYRQSITDGCIAWDDTVGLLDDLAATVRGHAAQTERPACVLRRRLRGRA